MVTFTGDDVRALFSHPAHQHGLRLVDTDKLFQCDGCRQLGDELRYRCEQCDFDLHACCAQAPARMEHSMFEGRTLTFFHSRPATATMIAGIIPFCDVCRDPVQGFLYHNREYDLDLHPVCTFLPKRVGMDGGHVLELHNATGHNCVLCEKDGFRGRSLAYRFQDDDGELVYIHVACMMEAHYSSDSQVAQASSTTTATGELVSAPMRRRGRFRRFCKVAFRVARVSYSVATLDPVGVVIAIASPI